MMVKIKISNNFQKKKKTYYRQRNTDNVLFSLLFYICTIFQTDRYRSHISTIPFSHLPTYICLVLCIKTLSVNFNVYFLVLYEIIPKLYRQNAALSFPKTAPTELVLLYVIIPKLSRQRTAV